MLYTSREYPVNSSTKAVFFLCPYGFKLSSFRIPIRKLQKAGFTVVGYDFSKSVLNHGDPAVLVKFITVFQSAFWLRNTIDFTRLDPQPRDDFLRDRCASPVHQLFFSASWSGISAVGARAVLGCHGGWDRRNNLRIYSWILVLCSLENAWFSVPTGLYVSGRWMRGDRSVAG